MKKQTCSKYATVFDLGLNGIIDKAGAPICDTCAGVTRDANGYAWFPGEIVEPFVTIYTRGSAVRLRPQ
jgi:hypothetical protein